MLRLHLKLVAGFFAAALLLTYTLPHLHHAVVDWEHLLVNCLPDILQRDDEGAIANAVVDLPLWQQFVTKPNEVLLPGKLDISDAWILPSSPLYSRVLWARPPPATSSSPV